MCPLGFCHLESVLSGTNQIIKPGQILFKSGDKSDGMYLIRRGEVCVYLEQEGKEVVLAKVGAGGMIGEMSLFDHQPRSASVKAQTEAEVTLISQDDFSKLMKQIPKWFVSLMSALSSRLRTTNERLKNLESGIISASVSGTMAPYANVLKQLHLIVLLFHKDGEKIGKDWVLRISAIETAIKEILQADATKLKALIEILSAAGIIQERLDNYKNPTIATANRTILTGLANFITEFCKNNSVHPYVTADVVSMLRTFEKMVATAPYETVSAGLDEIVKEGKNANLTTDNWATEIATLAKAGESLKLVKTSSGLGFRAKKAELAFFVQCCQVLAALYKGKFS